MMIFRMQIQLNGECFHCNSRKCVSSASLTASRPFPAFPPFRLPNLLLPPFSHPTSIYPAVRIPFASQPRRFLSLRRSTSCTMPLQGFTNLFGGKNNRPTLAGKGLIGGAGKVGSGGKGLGKGGMKRHRYVTRSPLKMDQLLLSVLCVCAFRSSLDGFGRGGGSVCFAWFGLAIEC